MRNALRLGLALSITGALVSCASDESREPVPLGIHFNAPKGLLDVDKVTLRVWDKALTSCKGTLLSGAAPDDASAVLRLDLAHTGKTWSGSGEIAKDPSKVLVFYAEGRKGGGDPTFSGCAEAAVDQNPMSVVITAGPYVVGGKCGDGAAVPPETCDPIGGTVDEACDGAKCQTKEVIVSNGNAGDQFYAGLPGRKTGVTLTWLESGADAQKLFAAWSDQATGGGGGTDGGNEITLRRLAPEVVTDSTSSVLASEIRLQPSDFFSTGGSKKRGGTSLSPAVVPAENEGLFVVFSRDCSGGSCPAAGTHIYGSLQKTNLGLAVDADFLISESTGTQDSPAAAGNGTGDVLVAWVDAGTIKSALRKAAGGTPKSSVSAPKVLSAGATNASPSVAWLGGDYVVVWSDGNDVQMIRIGADGTPKDSKPTTVNAARTPGTQDQPRVAGFSTGEFLVVFRSSGGDGDTGADIRIQKFDASGKPTGAEIGVPINDVNKDGDQATPVVSAAKPAAGPRFYLVAWTDAPRQQIAARFVNADGDNYLTGFANPISKSEFPVGIDARPRSSPAVAVGSVGFCAVAWADDSDGDAGASDDRVRVRRFPLPYSK